MGELPGTDTQSIADYNAETVWPPPPNTPENLSWFQLSLDKFISATSLARIVIVLLVVNIICETSEAIFLWIGGIMFSSFSDSVTTFQLLPYAAFAVVFLAWIYRLCKNLTALCVPGLRFSANDAVLNFFIPVLFLIRPLQVISEVWKASTPSISPAENPYGWRHEPSPVLIPLGWLAWISYTVVSWIGSPTEFHVRELGNMLGIISGILTVILVQQLTKRQNDKYMLLSELSKKI